MKILIVGANGATGRLLTEELLNRDHSVRTIVRSVSGLPEPVRQHKNLTAVEASVLDLSDAELAQHVAGCDAVASCLGHNLTFKGVYGRPQKLVTEATRRLCEAVASHQPTTPVKFVLMNTTGNRNGDLEEPISFAQKCVIGLLRLLLPPHVDNEQAAEYLRVRVGPGGGPVQWVVVRPDNLIDETESSSCELHPSPIRSAIFDAGQTSRINVAHFMADLITEEAVWRQWQGQMPVIYNKQGAR